MTAGEWRKVVRRWLEEGTFDRMLPEVAGLRGVPQPREFHREGDAFVHTMLAMEAVGEEEDELLFWGVLLHDIGKAATTRFMDGRWRAYGHDRAGAEMVPEVMRRVGLPELAEDVAWLVGHHLFHFSWNLREAADLTGRQRRFAEHPLFPLLLKLCAADAAASEGGSDKGEKAARLAQRLGCRAEGGE